jgi:hypothetical protein
VDGQLRNLSGYLHDSKTNHKIKFLNINLPNSMIIGVNCTVFGASDFY